MMRAFAVFAWVIASLAAFQPAQAESLLITAQKIYASPDAPPLSNASVLVRDGRVAEVADASRVRDDSRADQQPPLVGG